MRAYRIILRQLARLGECHGVAIAADWAWCVTTDGVIAAADGIGQPVLTIAPEAPIESVTPGQVAPLPDGLAHLDAETGVLRTLAIDPPAPARELGQLRLSSGYALATFGSFAYVAADAGGGPDSPDILTVLDLAHPETPRTVGMIPLPVGGIVSMVVGGGQLFMSTYDASLLAYSLADPARPKLLDTFDDVVADIRPDIAWLDGTVLVITHEQPARVIAVDARDPVNLRDVSDLTLPGFLPLNPLNRAVYAVDPASRRLFVQISTGIVAVDMADPNHMRLAGTTTATAFGLAMAGERLVAASGDGGVTIFRRVYRHYVPLANRP